MDNIEVGVRMPFELDSGVLRISFITLTQILWDIVNNNPKYTHLNNVTNPRGSSTSGKVPCISLHRFLSHMGTVLTY